MYYHIFSFLKFYSFTLLHFCLCFLTLFINQSIFLFVLNFNFLFSMNPIKTTRKQYMFSELSNLKLYDLKAQKKTMSMKKFQNIPLNNQ